MGVTARQLAIGGSTDNLTSYPVGLVGDAGLLPGDLVFLWIITPGPTPLGPAAGSDILWSGLRAVVQAPNGVAMYLWSGVAFGGASDEFIEFTSAPLYCLWSYVTVGNVRRWEQGSGLPPGVVQAAAAFDQAQGDLVIPLPQPFASPNNGTLACFATDDASSSTVFPGEGFTLLGRTHIQDVSPDPFISLAVLTEFKVNEQNPNAHWQTNDETGSCGIALELAFEQQSEAPEQVTAVLV